MKSVREFLKSGELPNDYHKRVQLGRDLWSLEGMTIFERYYYNAFGNINKRSLSERKALQVTRTYGLAVRLTLSPEVLESIAIPQNWLPKYMPETSLQWILAVLFAVPSVYDAGLSSADITFLSAQDEGEQSVFREYSELLAGSYSAETVAELDFFIRTGKVTPRLMEETPKESVLHADKEAMELATAFYKQAVDKAPHELPIVGQYVMTKTGLDLVDNLPFSHMRLVIKPNGIWLSIIHQADGYTTYSPCFWSPEYDNLQHVFRMKYAWVFRVMLACLWRDAKTLVYAKRHMRPENQRNKRTKFESKQGKIIYLPRKAAILTWDDDIPHVFPKARGLRTDYSVRAHYRKLTPDQEASEQAINNALDNLFPEPPAGYTFVQPYTVGSPPTGRPRIVAKGLQAAKVALSKL